ncbi:MAG: tRNA (N(6)-L-threonylcarbamoyladenosine(37)-C(2))-methylthiotransferase MtaB [Actinomycetota bacterium]
MPKVAFRTLGCRLNQAETDVIAEDLLGLGFEVVSESDDPDVIVVNTCTVTQEATRGSRKVSARAALDHPDSVVVVAGCYAVAEPEEAAAIPGVGMVATNDDKERLAQMIASRLGYKPLTVIPLSKKHGFPGADRSRVNLKVQTGCDEFCTFCIIPYTRGPLHSYPTDDLLKRAKAKVAEGARELVLTGVHLGKYGWDIDRPDDALVELLEGLLAIDGLWRIRLSSILSQHLTPRIVDLLATEARLCRFLHIPLQSGDDEVLERMNRPYRMADYRGAVERVKSSIPGVGLSTDVIVGFPGESAEQFQRTLDVVEEVGYMKLHVFRYSPRPGTPSASFAEQIPDVEKKARSKRLIALGNQLRAEFHSDQLDKVHEVLVEEKLDSGDLVGHTDNFIKVRFDGPSAAIDNLVEVYATELCSDGVRGTLV